jgi:hypothetical protein
VLQNRELVLNRVNLLSPPDFPRIWNLDFVKVGMAVVPVSYAFLGTGKRGDKGTCSTTVKINRQSRSKSTDFAHRPQTRYPAVPVVLNHKNDVYIGIVSQDLLIGRLNDHPDLPTRHPFHDGEHGSHQDRVTQRAKPRKENSGMPGVFRR